MSTSLGCVLALGIVLWGLPAKALEPVRVAGAEVGTRGTIASGPLEVIGEGSTPSSQTVLLIEQPVVMGNSFRVEGRVRTEGVQGVGYLEMWAQFSDGSRYFSRTLADSGPLARLQGTTEPRPFWLPFQSDPGSSPPTRLVVNVVLPGAGRVILDALRFVGDEGARARASQGAWWSERTAGLLGGVAGTCVGLVGALIGVLASLGAARALAVSLLRAIFAVGVAGLAAGVVGLALGQPHWVVQPLLVGGAIDVVLFLLLTPVLRRRYETTELRRLRAMDFR